MLNSKRHFEPRYLLGAVIGLAVISMASVAVAATSPIEWWVTGYAAPYVYDDWGTPSGIFYAPESGEVFMTDAHKQRVMVFDADGFERFRFYHTVFNVNTQRVMRGEPHDVLVTDNGLIYVTDFLGTNVSILNFRGERVGELDVAAALNVQKKDVRAQNLALGPDGIIYVTTAGNAAGILGFDATDQLVAKIGYDLEGFEAISQPNAFAVDAEGDFWIADLSGFPVIRQYSSEGRFLGGFGGKDVGHKDFSYPSDILCAADGTIWVADALRQAVKHFTANGEYIELIGGYGWNPGELRYPSSLAGDGVHEIYVSERVGRRIQKYYPAPDQGPKAENDES